MKRVVLGLAMLGAGWLCVPTIASAEPAPTTLGNQGRLIHRGQQVSRGLDHVRFGRGLRGAHTFADQGRAGRSGGTAVPELDPNAFAGAAALLAGGALVLADRRRRRLHVAG